MNIVRVETADQLCELIRFIFFRDDTEFTEFGDPSYSYEDLCSYLELDDSSLIPSTVRQRTDEWYNLQEQLNGDDVKKAVLIDRQIPILRDFKPGILVWHMEDGFDRVSSYGIRVFHYVTDEESSFNAHTEWVKTEQLEYDRRLKMEEELSKMRLQQK